jgi:hypothetical protein
MPQRPLAKRISRHLGLTRLAVGAVTATGLTIAGLAGSPAALAQTPGPATATFSYIQLAPTQQFTVPPNNTQVTITADGGSGWSASYGGGIGGAGAEVTATVPVTPGETLNVVVGGDAGADGNTCDAYGAYGACGGSGAGPGGSSPTYGGGGGGGGSEVSDASNNPLVVAGGGAGGGDSNQRSGAPCETSGGAGGNGGAGAADGDPAPDCIGYGGTAGGGGGAGAGTATAGGSGGLGGTASGCAINYDGGPGVSATGPAGADAITNDPYQQEAGGAGGGGYFGGGSGGGASVCENEYAYGDESGAGGGGGGSNFTAATATAVTIGTSSRPYGDSGQVTITYTGTSPEITSPASGTPLPAATAGVSYSTTITATGIPAPTFTATGLPTGLSISAGGVISGTTTDAGSYTVTVTASNGVAPAASATYSLTVNAGPAVTVTIDTGNNQSANTGQAFTTPLSVTVTDAYGNTVPGATVTFSIVPATGGTANFGGSTQTVTATTNSSGVATAPTLHAGSIPGAVTVTATSGTGQATFMETVISTAAARADLAISMSAPKILARGASGVITVTVTNNGPQAASNVLTLLFVPRGLTITGAGGGTVRNGVDYFIASTLAAGNKLTYTVDVRAGTARATVLLAAGTGSATRDPDIFNNITAAFLTIT